MPRFHWLALVSAFALAGCQTSSYAPGHSAADYPAEIKIVHLDQIGITPVANTQPPPETGGLPGTSSATRPTPPAVIPPSAGDREVMAQFKIAMIEAFRGQGIRVTEDDPTAPDLRLSVTVDYQPELGLYIHRSLKIGMAISNRNGEKLRDENYVDANIWFGALSSMVQSRDDMIKIAARKIVDQAVTEMRKRARTTQDGGLHVGLS